MSGSFFGGVLEGERKVDKFTSTQLTGLFGRIFEIGYDVMIGQ